MKIAKTIVAKQLLQKPLLQKQSFQRFQLLVCVWRGLDWPGGKVFLFKTYFSFSFFLDATRAQFQKENTKVKNPKILEIIML